MGVTVNQFPRILTALPRRRYQFGDYGATLLGEIESGDGIDYPISWHLSRRGSPGRPCMYAANAILRGSGPAVSTGCA
jgi:hypothetical protein